MTLKGSEDISLAYLYIGEAWELPRFAITPRESIQLGGETKRTFSGQVTGLPTETLRSFSAAYNRITNADKKRFDAYANGVQTVIPHVIDPYPDAHEEFEPFFATLAAYGEKEKRTENGFFWNFTCSWQEAK